MKCFCATVLVFGAAFAPATAVAAVTIGANVVVNRFNYPSADGSPPETVISAPGLASSIGPGLRLGFVTPGNVLAVNVDFRAAYVTGGGFADERVSDSLISLELDRNPSNSAIPFVTAGVGLHGTEVSVVKLTRAVFGAGLGVRHWLEDRRGAVRGELRFDRLPRGSLEGTHCPPANIFSMKLGFD